MSRLSNCGLIAATLIIELALAQGTARAQPNGQGPADQQCIERYSAKKQQVQQGYAEAVKAGKLDRNAQTLFQRNLQTMDDAEKRGLLARNCPSLEGVLDDMAGRLSRPEWVKCFAEVDFYFSQMSANQEQFSRKGLVSAGAALKFVAWQKTWSDSRAAANNGGLTMAKCNQLKEQFRQGQGLQSQLLYAEPLQPADAKAGECTKKFDAGYRAFQDSYGPASTQTVPGQLQAYNNATLWIRYEIRQRSGGGVTAQECQQLIAKLDEQNKNLAVIATKGMRK
jgi:hypothetical protein